MYFIDGYRGCDIYGLKKQCNYGFTKINIIKIEDKVIAEEL